MVVLPTPFLLEEKVKAKLKQYVAHGGVAFGTFLSAVKNKNNVAEEETLPAGLTDLFGLSVAEVEPVFENSVATIQTDIQCGSNRWWLEEVEPITAKVIGTVQDTFRKGKAVICENKYGKGESYYLGTVPEQQQLAYILDGAAQKAGVDRFPFSMPEGFEAVTRINDAEETYIFIFNETTKEAEIEVGMRCKNALTEERIPTKLLISAKDFVCIKV